jgi:FKBP-type peptidyl-prolyl cis-trans isomerase
MKKTPPVPARPARIPWLAIALLSLAAHAGLGAAWWHAAKSSSAEPPRADGGAPSELPPRPVAGPRELAPYRALGSFVAENNHIPDLGWTKAQFDAFTDGERASFEGRGLPLDDDAKRLRDDISRKVQAMIAAEQPDPTADYFRTLREKEHVLRTPSGLHYRITEAGEGDSPKPDDIVSISFTGSLPDGTALPRLSRTRVQMRVRDLLPGLAEGVQLLRVGAKALVYLPPALAFGDDNRPSEVPAQMPVVFFLELHDIEPAAPTQ